MFPHATRFTDHVHVGIPTPARRSAAAQIHSEREREEVRKRGRESCRASDALPSSSNMEVGEQVSAIFLSFCSIVAFVMLFLQFVQFCFFLFYTIRKYFANFLYKKGNPFYK